MKVLRIRDWQKHFEVSQSKRAGRIRWVAIPNHHDGKSYKRLMRANPTSYLAWVLLVQVASKCPVRGVLADDDGPLSAEDLEVKTECPVAIFRKAIPELCEVGWLESVEDGAKARPTRSVLGAYSESARSYKTGQDRTDKQKNPPTPPGGTALDPHTTVDPDALPLPAELQPYSAAVRAWLRYRAGIKKPVKTASVPALLRKMIELGPDLPLSLEESSAAGWQGFFAPKGARHDGKPVSERAARIEAPANKYAGVMERARAAAGATAAEPCAELPPRP